MTNDEGPVALARALARDLGRMGTGDLAELRRGRLDLAPAWWRLSARHDLRGDAWATIAQALALLTPKGPPEGRRDLHDPKRLWGAWGAALCDGGDPGWPARPRPVLSERRLALLLAARGEARRVLMLRAVRAVASHRTAGLDVGSLALSILLPDQPEIIARPYYARLDGAAREDAPTEDPDA